MSIIYRITALVFVIFLLAGCASPKKDLVAADKYSLQINPGTVSVDTTAKAFQDQNALVVSGKVKKLHEFRLPGKVQIRIYEPSGKMFAGANPSITNYASKKGGMKTARFSARFEPIPPKGSTISLQYHHAASQGGLTQ